jgi:hypothetical protein
MTLTGVGDVKTNSERRIKGFVRFACAWSCLNKIMSSNMDMQSPHITKSSNCCIYGFGVWRENLMVTIKRCHLRLQ